MYTWKQLDLGVFLFDFPYWETLAILRHIQRGIVLHTEIRGYDLLLVYIYICNSNRSSDK